METPDLEQTFSAAMDSVNLIDELVTGGNTDEETLDSLSRNADHLAIVIEKYDFSEEQIAQLQAGVDQANTVLD